ncbi:MAG TPA: hypothetical protein VJ386_10950 [Candidatus Deferrimicrobiaceae bacterium]|nr:hypothetical protein [Candidatus Deferrimicrobiaceae bacterium]
MPCPVETMTGSSGRIFRILRNVCFPPIPGNSMSSRASVMDFPSMRRSAHASSPVSAGRTS